MAEAGKFMVDSLYCFLSGPHESTYLGRANFRGESRYFFKPDKLSEEDRKIYFALVRIGIEKSQSASGLWWHVKPPRGMGLKEYELVLDIDKAGVIRDGYNEEDFSDEEQSQLLQILTGFGEGL